uniref:DUF4276 family protein n=1 Tax=Cyanothece sp. (strain PCC 7425 / ATCC 29141) TaxID=395961 RepID=B8HUQ9_CYAP4
MAIRSRVLLVEGKEDLRVIPELMEANGVIWRTKNTPVVHIYDYDGYENLAKPKEIETQLEASGLTALGIIIDADEDPALRWQSIRNACLQAIPDLPEQLSPEGLIHLTAENIKFGIWMMPDNTVRGMLETFLAYIVPDGNKALWQLAQQVSQTAKSKGAAFKDSHCDKANIYTWLAWQDPPGRQLHDAIKQHIFKPTHPNAQQFVTWFKTLYDLPEELAFREP